MTLQTLKNKSSLLLRSKGFKITKVRSNLIEILTKTTTPLSINDLLEKLEEKDLKPNKTTVYREIVFLTDQGLVSGVDFGEGKKRYEGSSKEHHHHVVCINCKKVQDIHMEKDLDKLMEKITRQVGYKSVGHSLEFFGLCKTCQN